jgi:hypothetical protein
MTSERIKEIQQQTAYPDSISVQHALLQVWNECSQLPQQEISDEEIEKESSKLYGVGYLYFSEGAKWYKKQLKTK